jgi:hypothetical protein
MEAPTRRPPPRQDMDSLSQITESLIDHSGFRETTQDNLCLISEREGPIKTREDSPEEYDSRINSLHSSDKIFFRKNLMSSRGTALDNKQLLRKNAETDDNNTSSNYTGGSMLKLQSTERLQSKSDLSRSPKHDRATHSPILMPSKKASLPHDTSLPMIGNKCIKKYSHDNEAASLSRVSSTHTAHNNKNYGNYGNQIKPCLKVDVNPSGSGYKNNDFSPFWSHRASSLVNAGFPNGASFKTHLPPLRIKERQKLAARIQQFYKGTSKSMDMQVNPFSITQQSQQSRGHEPYSENAVRKIQQHKHSAFAGSCQENGDVVAPLPRNIKPLSGQQNNKQIDAPSNATQQTPSLTAKSQAKRRWKKLSIVITASMLLRNRHVLKLKSDVS